MQRGRKGILLNATRRSQFQAAPNPMETLQLPSVPILATSLLSFLFILFTITWRKSKSKDRRARPPPGPWKLPLIGCLHHLFGQLPHRAFRHLASTHGPLMLIRIGQVDAVVASSRDAAEEILQHKGIHFADRPDLLAVKIIAYGGSDLGFSPYSPYWKQLRKICVMELLSARRTRSFAAIRAEETQSFVRDIARAAPALVHLSSRLFSLSNTIVCRAAFGKRRDRQERFLQLVREALELSSGFCVVDTFPSLRCLDRLLGVRRRIEHVHRHLDAILVEIIEEHRSSTGPDGEAEDLMDVLLRLKDDPDLETPLSMDNVKAVVLDMFIAGTETSSTLVEWCMSELMRHPEIMERAQREVREVAKGKNRVDEIDIAELHYLKLVIKETLRLRPPVPLVPRQCRESCEVMGYTIEVGMRVFINTWAIGRDPRYWDEPKSFKPERFEGNAIDHTGADFQYLPFGGGRRICPGVGFGMATVELALAQLLFHFDWELPNGMKPDELDMSETVALVAPRKNVLELIPTVKIPVPELTTTP